MDYKGYSARTNDYRSPSTGQPNAAPIDGHDVTATKPPLGQYAHTFECRFPNPPPWNVAPPPCYPPALCPPVFPRTSGSNFHLPPSDCGNWPDNPVYEAKQNFNTSSRSINSAAARFSNNKEYCGNSASSLVQKNVPSQFISQQGNSALEKEPYVPAPQCSINTSQNLTVGSVGFQNQQSVFHQHFTCPPPPLPHSLHQGTDISLQRFTIPPPKMSHVPRFDSSSNQQICYPVNQGHESSVPQISNQPSSRVRFQPRFQQHSPLAGISNADENCCERGSKELGAGHQEFCDPHLSQNFSRTSVNLQEDQVDSGNSRIQSSSHHVAPWCLVSNSETCAVQGPVSNSALSNFSNWSGVTYSNKATLHCDEPPILMSDNLELKNDMEWIVKWRKQKKSAKKRQFSENSRPLSMTAVRSLLMEAVRLNDKLKDIIHNQDQDSHCDETTNEKVKPEHAESADSDSIHFDSDCKTELDSMKNAEPKTGFQLSGLSSTVSAIQKRLNEIRSIITDEIVLTTKEKLQKITKKRNRLKRKRQEDFEEKQEDLNFRMQKDKEIDNWQMGIQTELTKLKKDKEIKTAADETLSEVRRKLTEAKRALAVLANIRKLRSLKKDKASRKGMRLETESDAIFEERVTAQTDILKRQIDMYELEERTLEVMLETEQEANMEREKKLQKKKEDEKIQKYEKQLRAWLFGKEDVLSPSDPLYPYRQYYDVGSNNLGAFLRIRQEWDMYAVPFGTPGGSTVPFGWVAPVEPSSDIWAVALEN